ncbi:MAG: sulfotransferase [Pseudomonadales bacterium]|jgi:tetratricopeptide (TPR) repeat protein|nr:sulfotransferase [Pseudomonadales bacterium]
MSEIEATVSETPMRDYQSALIALQEQLAKDNNDVAALEKIGGIYLKVGQIDQAIGHFKDCIKRAGSLPKYYLNLGHAYKAQGQFDEAISAYQRVAESPIEKVAVTGLFSLANLKRYEFNAAEIRALSALSTSAELGLGHQCLASFALGTHQEASGDIEQAYTSFEAANAGIGQIRPFQGQQYQALIKTMIDFIHTADWTPSESSFEPIFIVGMPRTGSTLIEQILSAHSKVEATDELMLMSDIAISLEHAGGYATRLRRLQADKVSELVARYLRLSEIFRPEQKIQFIDKNPNNFLHIGLIKRLFPSAKIINVIRDPLDNALSVYKQFFAEGHEYSYSIPGIIFYWQGYLTLMKHWDAVFPGQIYHLDYEALVKTPEPQIRQLLAYCGLAAEPLCFTPHLSERPVLTPSAAQVRNPISAKSLGSGLQYKQQVLAHLPQIAAIKHQANAWFLGA